MSLLRGILILWPIRESVLLLHIISKRFLYKKYDQLFVTWLMQKIQAGKFFNSAVSLLLSCRNINPRSPILFVLNQPVGDVGDTKSMSQWYQVLMIGPSL